MTEADELYEAQLKAAFANKLADSLRAAAGEILGRKTENFNQYFQIHWCEKDGKPGVAVVERVTGQSYKLAYTYEELEGNSDRSYYMELKRLAKIVNPLIPAEEKDIPRDEWPEPKWEKPE